MGQISYEDKMRTETFQEIGFGTEKVLQIFLKRVRRLAR